MGRGVDQGAAPGILGVGGTLGKQLGGKGPRGGGLAGAGGPAEEVGVGRLSQVGAQLDPDAGLVAGCLGKRIRKR